jgi:molybdenum cofactor synthesis domain-containing protein
MNNKDSDYKAAVLIASDRSYNKIREDAAGPALEKRLKEIGFDVVHIVIAPDEEDKITVLLKSWVNGEGIDLIITSGGTGVAPRDVTPEATLKVIEKRVPGIEEVMRGESLKHTPNAMLSRSVAGTAKTSLIINLPGNPKGALENLNAVAPALVHALDLIKGKRPDR